MRGNSKLLRKFLRSSMTEFHPSGCFTPGPHCDSRRCRGDGLRHLTRQRLRVWSAGTLLSAFKAGDNLILHRGGVPLSSRNASVFIIRAHGVRVDGSYAKFVTTPRCGSDTPLMSRIIAILMRKCNECRDRIVSMRRCSVAMKPIALKEPCLLAEVRGIEYHSHEIIILRQSG